VRFRNRATGSHAHHLLLILFVRFEADMGEVRLPPALTFNSLCEIPSLPSSAKRTVSILSILFVRFAKWLRNKRWFIATFQFSLWDSYSWQCWRWLAFMSFNSLCEIQVGSAVGSGLSGLVFQFSLWDS